MHVEACVLFACQLGCVLFSFFLLLHVLSECSVIRGLRCSCYVMERSQWGGCVSRLHLEEGFGVRGHLLSYVCIAIRDYS